MKILGLDPALRCGFAHSDGPRGLWLLGEMDGFRQLNLLREILEAAKTWGVEKIAAEDASFGAINRKTQAFHNELRGVLKLAAAELKVPIVFYHPTSIKAFATNDGHAPKDQMVRACETLFGFKPEDDNVADAVFVLEMAKQNYRPKPSGRKSRSKPRKAAGQKQASLFAKGGKIRQVRNFTK